MENKKMSEFTELTREIAREEYNVSRLLGHEDLSSTQIYLHPSQDAAIQEAKKVKFFLGRIPAEVELMLRSGFGPESRD
jgi:hypothetical protein